jgi:hypothetical protein
MPGVTSSNYDVTPDGQRFLMVRDDDVDVASHTRHSGDELGRGASRARRQRDTVIDLLPHQWTNTSTVHTSVVRRRPSLNPARSITSCILAGE